MTLIVERIPYSQATLQDLDSHAISTGAAHVDTKTRQAAFFPSKTENVDAVLKKAAILEMEGGATFLVLRIEHTEIPQWGYADPHYEIEIDAPRAPV